MAFDNKSALNHAIRYLTQVAERRAAGGWVPLKERERQQRDAMRQEQQQARQAEKQQREEERQLKAIGGGSFSGTKMPSADKLAKLADKFIYHSGTVDQLDNMKWGLEPQHGDWIKEVAAGAIEDPDKMLDRSVPLVWMSDNPSWVSMKVARKIGKHPNEVTEDDIRQHGHVAMIPRKGDHAEHIWKVGNEGLDNGPYSTVTNLNGKKAKAYETDLYESDMIGQKEPFGVERNEYISAKPVEPMFHLTGDDLVTFLKHTNQLPQKSEGGLILSKQYPTHYMPNVGRQVMQGGGVPEEQPSPMIGHNNPLQGTFETENRPHVIVSPAPGRIGRMPEEGLDPSISQEGDLQTWSPSTPNLIGAPVPPPVQHPVYNQPRMKNLVQNTSKIFKSPGFKKLIKDQTGLENVEVTPTVGTWKTEMEPSFIVSHPDMQPEHAHKIANMVGFGMMQDATVQGHHNPSVEDGIPALLIGKNKKLSTADIDKIHEHAKNEGLDFSVTKDGKAAKFLHFGGEGTYDDFLDKVARIADNAKMPERLHARTSGDLINEKEYFNGIFGSPSGEEGVQASAQRSPDLFRRIVDHVLAPYAKAIAGEGYRLSPERLAETHGLTDEEKDYVRNAFYPKTSDDRTTVPLMTGEEQLDVQPTGARGESTVGDVLYALQNRAASKGQIDPGDFSDKAKSLIADSIAKEVAYHIKNTSKSAIGWYDAALKKAMSKYATIFPELSTDPNKEMLFHAILGMTSQGNDVYNNSVHAARLYNLVRNGDMGLDEAVQKLKGSFGDKTAAIEQNLLKFHHLIGQNGFDQMRDIFNKSLPVSQWNRILKDNENFYGPDGKPLRMQGGKDQKVTGWMVFGPKIGSFINNLHGDYSTLTADLWFSRTWNRLLGHNFIHTPLAEQKQYQDLKDAMQAEWVHHNGFPFEQQQTMKKEGKPWDYGNDLKGMPRDEFENLINDPDRMLEFAQNAEQSYRKGQYKEKSDVKRRSKNWIENRELPQAAPRGDAERSFQQNTVEEAQNILKKKYGVDISVADIQAALWFHEKELFGKLGVASEKAQPADYADAADHTMNLIGQNKLYEVKSKQKNKGKEEFARGGQTRSRHPALSIAGTHIREEEHGEPMFTGRL